MKLIETDGERYENMRSLKQNLTFNETSLEFAKQNIAFKITLFNRNETFLYRKTETDNRYLVKECPKNSLTVDLSLKEVDAMNVFKKQTIVYRKDIQDCLNCSQAVAIRVLKSLLDKNLIQYIGKGRSTSYTML